MKGHCILSHGFESGPDATKVTALAEAADTLGFFFGEAMARAVRDARSPTIPEWTGVWWGALPS